MLDTLMALVVKCGRDVEFEKGDPYSLTLLDTDGYNNDGEIDYQEYENPDNVDVLLDWLENNCKNKNESLYDVYFFDGFSVQVGCLSYDMLY